MADVPKVRQTVLDTTDARQLAEFYRRLLGYTYRDGDEPPAAGEPDERGQDWLVLRSPDGHGLAFQQVDKLPRPTWPANDVPQQLHLDMTVDSVEQLEAQTARALSLGAKVLYDRIDDPEEPLRVVTDPAGHPFCIFVG